MSDLDIKQISIEDAKHLVDYDISLKRDGTLIYYTEFGLCSPRCNRSERFAHILKILKEGGFPYCIGEMFIDEPKACVFDVSRKENWAKAKFMPFDLFTIGYPYSHRKMLLDDAVKQLNNSFIVPVTRFKTFDEGWAFVKANDGEGLVLRNNSNWFKCKILREEKIEIVSHETGRDKGTFILSNGNRISGTSMQFVGQFLDIKARGKKPIAEVEFPFYTSEGKMFQPRLRQITEEN